MSTTESQLALGRRVAEQRRRHGWSQPELAYRLGKPVSWISRLERGLVLAEPVFLPQLALGVLPVPDLAAVDADGPRADDVAALRRVLDGRHQYRPRLTVLAIRTAADCQSRTAQIWELTISGRYGELAELVHTLIPVLHATLRALPGRHRAAMYELLAASYQACSASLAKLGDSDGAVAAADLALDAAQCVDDPVAVAGCAYLLACILMEAGRDDSAQAVAAAAAAALAAPSAGGDLSAVSFRGALTLLCALSAARMGDLPGAEEYLSRARVMAGRLSHHPGERPTGFSADHVALYEIAVGIEAAAKAHGVPATGPEIRSARPRPQSDLI